MHIDSSLVGSVPTCKLAAVLWKDYHVEQPHKSGQIPIGGVILQSALYSGKKTFFGGCLLGSQDPYDNASEIVHIEVRSWSYCFSSVLICRAQSFSFTECWTE